MQPHEREVLHYVVAGKDLFGEWLDNLPDLSARASIRIRIGRVANGNLGDCRCIGQGVWELRVHYGPGYRVYYGEAGARVILLICGGEKHTQKKDIRKALRIWADCRRLK